MAPKKLSKNSVRRHKRVEGGRNDPQPQPQSQPQPNWSTAQISHQQINDLARILTNEEINNLRQERNSQHDDVDSDSDENLNLQGNPCLRCLHGPTYTPLYEEACEACRNELYNYDMPQTPPRRNIPQTQTNRQTNIQPIEYDYDWFGRNPFDQWRQGRQTVPLEDQYRDDVDYTFYARENQEPNQGPYQDAGKKKKHKKKKTLKNNKKSKKKRNTKKKRNIKNSYKNKKRTRRR